LEWTNRYAILIRQRNGDNKVKTVVDICTAMLLLYLWHITTWGYNDMVFRGSGLIFTMDFVFQGLQEDKDGECL